MSATATYRPRHPERTPFYQCLEDYWEEFQQSYPYFYEAKYGPWRPVVEKTVDRFLECGIFRHGFARLKCGRCSHQALLAFSCKTRYLCPSCQAKRVAAFVEWVTEEVLEAVNHRQYVWTIPRVLRPAFRRDRRLLGDLARCAWKTLRQYFQAALGKESVPGAIVAIQSYGDTLNFHPHLHSLVPDGAWDRSGTVSRISYPDSQILTRLFAHHVREMLISKRRLSRDFANRLASWHHSGFHVYCSRPVDQDDKPALERLAASRLHFDEQRGQIEYQTKQGLSRSMDALDWIALVTSHIPGSNEQMIRYYGRYSNASRGRRRQALALCVTRSQPDCDDLHSPAEAFGVRRRANWARLLKNVYEVDPLTCPRCAHQMSILAFIEDPRVILRILQHLGSWQRAQRSPPPPLLAHKLEAFLATLSPTQAQQVRVSTDSIFWDDLPVFED